MQFYISSNDSIDFEKPVKVISFQKARILKRNCLVVELEKSFDYNEFGGPASVSKFILLDRFSDNRLDLLIDFPIEVHMLIPVDKNDPLKGFNKWSDLFNAAWAELNVG